MLLPSEVPSLSRDLTPLVTHASATALSPAGEAGPTPSVLARMTRLAADTSGASGALLVLERSGVASMVSAIGLAGTLSPDQVAAVAGALDRAARSHGGTLAIEDLRGQDDACSDGAASGLLAMTACGAVSMLAVSVGEPTSACRGVLCVLAGEPRDWGAPERQMLRGLGDCIVAAVAQQDDTTLARELANQEARQRRFLDRLPGVVFRYVMRPDESARAASSPGDRAPHAEKDEYDTETLLELIHPDDRDAFDASLAESARTHEPWSWEGRLRRHDDTETWVQWLSLPERGPNGSLGWDGIMFDVTERKRLECERVGLLERERSARAEAEDAHRRVSEILESVTDAFLAMDREWRITHLNARASALLRSDRTSLLGSLLWEVYPAALGTTFEREYRRVMDTGVATTFEEFFAPLHTWFEVHAYPADGGVALYFRDVTARKAAENEQAHLVAALHAERSLLQSVLSQLPVGVMLAEVPSGRLISGNAQIERIFRRPFIALDEVAEYRAWEAYHLDGRPVEPEEWPLARVLRTASAVEGEELEFVRGDDTRAIFRMSAAPIIDGEGAFKTAVVVIHDVTEQWTAERALRDSEERFRLISHATNVVIWDWDLLTSHLFWSEAIEKVFGHSPDGEQLHLSWWEERVHPDDRDRVLTTLRHALSRSDVAWVEEYRFLRGDGRYAMVYDRASIMRNEQGTPVRLVGSMEDVTERTRAAAEIRVQSLLLDAVKQAVLAMTLDGTITYWNRFAEQLYGWTAEEAIGRDAVELLLAPELRGHAAQIRGLIARGEGSTGELRVRRKDGSTFVAEVSDAPLHDREGRLIGVVGVLYDVTDKRHLQKQLLEATKMEAIGQLAAGIAHEINTPTQYVGDNVRFLRDAWTSLSELLVHYRALHAAAGQGPVSPELLAAADDAEAAADTDFLSTEFPLAVEQSLEGIERIGEIVRSVRAFSHPGSGEAKPVDLNRELSQTAIVARNEWKYVASLETCFDDTLPAVRCFAGDINQAVLNLIVNAAHSIDDARALRGGMGKIEVGTRRDGDTVLIWVSDTGMGIPEGVRPRIFDPFFTTKPVGRGTGQGLAIAYTAIVEKHGGRIWFETEMGRGTTFYIRIPLEAEDVIMLARETP
jgi:PAS domain S-box-containing protein